MIRPLSEEEPIYTASRLKVTDVLECTYVFHQQTSVRRGCTRTDVAVAGVDQISFR